MSRHHHHHHHPASYDGVTKELTSVTSKLRSVSKKTNSLFSSLDAALEACGQAAADPASQASALEALKASIATIDPLAKTKADNRTLHNAISKLGKAVEKHVVPTPPTLASLPFDGLATDGVNAAVVDHLHRRGLFAEAETVSRTTRAAPPDPTVRRNFDKLYRIVAAMDGGDYTEALTFIAARRTQFRRIGTTVEFDLHALQFVALLSGKTAPPKPTAIPPVALALAYAREVFPQFAELHSDDIARLMGAVLFADCLPTSPYADLVSLGRLEKVKAQFVRDSCTVCGLTPTSALELTASAGTRAMPTLVKLSTVLQSTGSDILAESVLPAEVDLPTDMQFHSVFACPVSREQAQPGNPPMLLTCGHVISKESLLGMTARRTRFKCPTCPAVQAMKDVKEVFLG